jgi:hypothetical protein
VERFLHALTEAGRERGKVPTPTTCRSICATCRPASPRRSPAT